jgi:hypothetical protein
MVRMIIFLTPLWLPLALLGMAPTVLAQAQTPLTSQPEAINVTSTLPNGAFAASIRLLASSPITGVQIFVSDLMDATGDGQPRDVLASNTVEVLPAVMFEQLPAESLTQLLVKVAPPAVAGVYTGHLIVRWEQPQRGQLEIPLRVTARTLPVLQLQDPSDPGEITLNGTVRQQFERHIVLRETSGGGVVQGLHIVPQDLIEANTGRALPAGQVRVALAAQQLVGGDLLTATMHLNLRRVPPGVYKGKLLFAADPNLLLALPLTVNVRHGWWWPLIVVIIGVLLGLGLSSYQARGKRRDEFVIQIAALRDALKDDPDLNQGFGPRMEVLLAEANAAVRSAAWPDAEAKVTEANQLVTRWRSQRQDWQKQLAYLRNELTKKLDEARTTAVMVRKLRQSAADLSNEAANYESPKALRDKILELEQSLQAFEQLEARVENLEAQRETFDAGKVEPATYSAWQSKETDLTQKLESLLPEQADAFAALEAEVAAQEAALRQYTTENPQALKVTPQAALAMSDIAPTTEGQAGALIPEIVNGGAYDPVKAGGRLRWYSGLVYIVGGLLLAAVGLNTLYVNNPTFGANWLGDYLSLLIFGLGAETTFASVADLMRRWGLPAGN